MENPINPYRLVTRNDMNGLASAALLYYLNVIDNVAFAHPRDIESGKFKLTERDITANLPYFTSVHLAFQHRINQPGQLEIQHTNLVINSDVDSTARVIYDYYGGREKFPSLLQTVVAAADKSNSAMYTIEDVLQPKEWDLLSFTLDPQTGLGRFKDFKMSTDELVKGLAKLCVYSTIEEILAKHDVAERVELYLEQESSYDEQIKRCATVIQKVLVVDLREETRIYAGNRFRVYALYPSTNISMQVYWSSDEHKTILISVGKSVFDRSSKVDVGMVMKQFGGGGHVNAGSVQVDLSEYISVRDGLINQFV